MLDPEPQTLDPEPLPTHAELVSGVLPGGPEDDACLGFRVWGLGFRVWGLGFGVWGLWFGV